MLPGGGSWLLFAKETELKDLARKIARKLS